MNLQKGQAYPRVRSATGEGKEQILLLIRYRQTEYVVINRKSREYELIRMYEKLDSNAQKRLEGYMHALGELK